MSDNDPDTGYSSCEDTEARYNISSPREEQRTGKAGNSPQNNSSELHQYPIKNLVQGTTSCQDDRGARRHSRSSSCSGDGLTETEGWQWHGPVTQRTRPVPLKYYGRLQVSSCSDSEGQQAGKDQFFRRDGWTEIPIQRI